MPRLSIRIDLDPQGRVGPGKIELLECIARTGSISAGGRAMTMSYRRAWELVDSLGQLFGQPVVLSQTGGRHGGGARLTPFGEELVARYRQIERVAEEAAAVHLQALHNAMRRPAVAAPAMATLATAAPAIAASPTPGASSTDMPEVAADAAPTESRRPREAGKAAGAGRRVPGVSAATVE